VHDEGAGGHEPERRGDGAHRAGGPSRPGGEDEGGERQRVRGGAVPREQGVARDGEHEGGQHVQHDRVMAAPPRAPPLAGGRPRCAAARPSRDRREHGALQAHRRPGELRAPPGGPG
jgi:hypothetical protein